MNKLRRNINKFYAMIGDTTTLTKSDMYDRDTLMDAYESIWFTMDEQDLDDKWLSNLYGELGDYIAEMPSTYKWYSATMGNIVQTFGEVVAQVWNSLIHYHTIDIRWHYCRKGY